MSFSIKNPDKLPEKYELYDGESTYWVWKSSHDNTFKIYKWLKDQLFKDLEKGAMQRTFSLSRISEGTKIQPRQVTYAIMIMTAMKPQLVQVNAEITPGGKPKNSVKLIHLQLKDREELKKILPERGTKE